MQKIMLKNLAIAHSIAALVFLLQSRPVVALPEVPVIMRDVASIENNQFVRPYMPAIKTTADGRVGINSKFVSGNYEFYILRPEGLSGHFTQSEPGATILSEKWQMPGSTFRAAGGGNIIHSTICDTGWSNQYPAKRNPYACGGGSDEDCYDVTVITATNQKWETENGSFGGASSSAGTYIGLWGTKVTIHVTNPKTANASIGSIEVKGGPTKGGVFKGKNFFELMTTGDGKLLIGRVDDKGHVWSPDGQTSITQYLNIVYMYNGGDTTCDVGAWAWNGADENAVLEWTKTNVHPITHAYHDDRLNAKYGFAKFQMKDTEGNLIQDGVDLKATYPWIDREGRNLFFTTIADTSAGRGYESICAHLSSGCAEAEDAGATRGHSVAGLWTKGKIVLLDSMLDNTDYGMKAKNAEHKLITLYEPNTGANNNESGDVDVGAGRDNSPVLDGADPLNNPDGWLANTSLTDSPEHLFNQLGSMKPASFADVTWLLNNGKASDEVVFDDYLNDNSFIISPMNGSVTYGETLPSQDPATPMVMTHNTGWNGNGFSGAVHLQNAATSEHWVLPAYGIPVNGVGSAYVGRIEPVALGGIKGKGFWLEDTIGIKYEIPTQASSAVPDSDWYYALFVDLRVDEDSTERTLIRFPDGSEIRLLGRSKLRYYDFDDASGEYSEKNEIVLSAALPNKAWSHLAFEVKKAGKQVIFYRDGFAANKWVAIGGESLFSLDGDQQLYIGKQFATNSEISGIKGWIDEFKVFAQGMSAEEACNHARGTLVGFDDDATSSVPADLADLANGYPAWAHDSISDALKYNGKRVYNTYACYHNYANDDALILSDLPGDVYSVRDDLRFPEGPLFYGLPRPDSSGNQVCLACHSATGEGSLTQAALGKHIGINAEDDDRRQPMQSPQWVSGVIPVNWLDGVEGMTLADAGTLLDEWTLKGAEQNPPTITGFTIIDKVTRMPVMRLNSDLSESAEINLLEIGVDAIDIQANTSGAVDSVEFASDGGAAVVASDSTYPFTALDSQVEFKLDIDYVLTAAPVNSSGPGDSKEARFKLVKSDYPVAMYKDDFTSNSPKQNWFYLCNSKPMDNSGDYSQEFSRMKWDAMNNIYSCGVEGAVLGLNGVGKPGKGYNTDSDSNFDGFAVTGYKVPHGGTYKITGLKVTESGVVGDDEDGVVVKIYVNKQKHKAWFVDSISINVSSDELQLSAGDMIYVAIGPRTSRSGDEFVLDYNVVRIQ